MTIQEQAPVYKVGTHEQVATMQRVAQGLGEQAATQVVEAPEKSATIDFYVNWPHTD